MYTTKRDTLKNWRELFVGVMALAVIWLGSVAMTNTTPTTVADVVNRVAYERGLSQEEMSQLAERVSVWVTQDPTLMDSPMALYRYLGGRTQ